MGDLARHRIRGWIEARILDASAGQMHARYGARKAEVVGAMRGTVVEIGPGTGNNLRYYAAGTSVIAIEPNPAMHGRLRKHAREHGVDLDIRTSSGEAIGLPDHAADGVVGTLVLCGVDDPDRVLSEVRRVLKPGGTFFFIEHVRAPAGTWTRRIQRLVRRPHRWMFNGCVVDRDTESALRRAGFDRLELAREDAGPAGLYVRHRVVGTAG